MVKCSESFFFPVARVCIRGVSKIQGSGLKGFHCIGLCSNCGCSTSLFLI